LDRHGLPIRLGSEALARNPEAVGGSKPPTAFLFQAVGDFPTAFLIGGHDNVSDHGGKCDP
jgi:hypothetical protein